LIGLSVSSGVALGDDPAIGWAKGLEAFDRGDFTVALTAFESALTAGQSGPAVHYNIGVCQFKIGDFDAAATTFARISRDYLTMRGLAEYNLGLVAYELDQSQAARRHFLAAYRSSPDDENLRILASTMLRRMESTVDKPSKWIGALAVNTGYDDNIILRDDINVPADLTADSPLLDLFGSVRGPIAESIGIYVDASAYLISYLDEPDLDQREVTAGVSYDLQRGDWRARVGVNLGYSTFGGEAYDDSRNFFVRMTRNLGPDASLQFRYQYADISAAEPIFSAIDGSRQRFEFKYRWNRESQRFEVAFLGETNDRVGPGVSPTRSGLRLSYRYSLNAAWTARFGGNFRVSRYRDLDPDRTEDLVTLDAGVSRSFRSNWHMLATYEHARNSSTDDLFSYTRHQLSIGLLKIF